MFPWQPHGLLSILSLPVLFPSPTPRPASDHPKMGGGGGARQRGGTVKVTFLPHYQLDEQTLCLWRRGEKELQGRADSGPLSLYPSPPLLGLHLTLWLWRLQALFIFLTSAFPNRASVISALAASLPAPSLAVLLSGPHFRSLLCLGLYHLSFSRLLLLLLFYSSYFSSFP